jgi:hypothetical protein
MIKTVDADDDYNGFITGCNSSRGSERVTGDLMISVETVKPILLLSSDSARHTNPEDLSRLGS